MSGKIKTVLKKFLEILVDEIDGKNSTPSLTGSNSNCIQDCISGNLVNLYDNKTIVDARNSLVNVNALNNINNGEIILDVTNKKLNIDKLVFSENLEIYNTSDTIVKIDSNGNITAPQFIGNAATATTALACSGNAASATTSLACSGNAASASSLVPSLSPQITGNFNGTGDAVLGIQTSSRGYQWRFRARGNGCGAELYLEYLSCNDDGSDAWKVAPGGYWGAYKDAKGGGSAPGGCAIGC